MLRFLTAGESHGPCLVAILEGLPAGLRVKREAIDRELRRRQLGYGRGGRMAIERDRVQVLSGLRGGKTLGSPLALMIENRDWENWLGAMDPFLSPRGEKGKAVTGLRPGHADLAGALKYGQCDIRNISERASARETAARVAVGAVCRELLGEFDIGILSAVVAIGKVAAKGGLEKALGKGKKSSLSAQGALRKKLDASAVRCIDGNAAKKMVKEIDRACQAGDTLGGIFEVAAPGVCPGLGSYVQWDRRLDARLAMCLMSIPGIKGVEIGLGFGGAKLPGSGVHDIIAPPPRGKSGSRWFQRKSNRAGGLEGGVTNGETVLLRAAMKPIATLGQPLPSLDLATGKVTEAARERADVCAVAAASVIGEAVVAIELAGAVLEKFGGDSLDETKRNFRAYLDSCQRGF